MTRERGGSGAEVSVNRSEFSLGAHAILLVLS